jgi:hypothetical protein
MSLSLFRDKRWGADQKGLAYQGFGRREEHDPVSTEGDSEQAKQRWPGLLEEVLGGI